MKKKNRGRPSVLRHHRLVQCRDPYLSISSCSMIWFEASATLLFGAFVTTDVVGSLAFAARDLLVVAASSKPPRPPDFAKSMTSAATTMPFLVVDAAFMPLASEDVWADEDFDVLHHRPIRHLHRLIRKPTCRLNWIWSG